MTTMEHSCYIPLCDDPESESGLCSGHYRAWSRDRWTIGPASLRDYIAECSRVWAAVEYNSRYQPILGGSGQRRLYSTGQRDPGYSRYL
jgi:hypothetical protein